MYAYFERCDPVKSGKLQNVDQTVPYLVVRIFQDLPGMVNLFVAAAYSGMLRFCVCGYCAMSILNCNRPIKSIIPASSDNSLPNGLLLRLWLGFRSLF